MLYNLGGPDIFNLTIGVDNASAPFYQTISPTYVLLDRNETSEFIVTVTASENAIDGERILYTASVASTNGIEEKSDFTTFEVYASTIPPPSRCENVRYNNATVLALWKYMHCFATIQTAHIIITCLKVNYLVDDSTYTSF